MNYDTAIARDDKVHPALITAQRQLKANIYETAAGEAYVIEVPVPGLNSEEITFEATIDTVTATTKPQQTEADFGRTYIQHEQLLQPMSRIFEFPVEGDRYRQCTVHAGKGNVEDQSAQGSRGSA